MKGKRIFFKGSIFCVLALSLILLPTISFSATFCVGDEAELQAALTTAASNGEDNVIRIIQGTYNGNFTYASTEEYSLTVEGGYTEDCASREIDPANTILDGGGLDTVLALVSQGAADFSVEGLILRNGSASTVDHGGGLYAKTEDGNVTLTNNTFTGNTATDWGGGVYISNYYGVSVTLTNNTFTENTAYWGGGVYISGGGTLTDNTFTGNTATHSGGGVHIFNPHSGSGTLTDNTFTENTAMVSGGGVYISGSGTLTDNTFTENTSNGPGGDFSDNGGGGVYIWDKYSDVTSTLINNTFTGNTATDSGGGVVGGRSILTNNTFTGNTAANGGGVYGGSTLINNIFTGNTAMGRGGGANVGGLNTLTNNTFTGNTAANGGGVYGGSTLINNIFTGNTAYSYGGGVHIQSGTLTNNTFSVNTANSGGGACIDGGSEDGSTLTNNKFTGNTAADKGGGVWVNSSKDVTLTNNTISANVAETEGGGVWLLLSDSDITGAIYNNIIWNNSAPGAADLYIDNTGDDPFFPVSVDLFNNDFDKSASGTYIHLPFPVDPSNLDNEDPLFVDAASGDYHLTANSPCRDAGDNNAPELPETDMDGQPRIMDGIVDIGADEYPGAAEPAAGFSAEPLSGPGPLIVIFTDESIGTIDSWEWDFGDGSPLSHERNPAHIYESPGTYTVSLSVSGPYGADTEVKTDYITVTLAEPVPDVKANGEDGPLFVAPGENVNVSISLDPGGMAGERSDWWIGVMSPYGTFPIFGRQIPLFELPETSLFDIPLPTGLRIFYFILDDNPNGIFDSMTWYDYVVVIVSSGPLGRQMQALPNFEALFQAKIKELMRE